VNVRDLKELLEPPNDADMSLIVNPAKVVILDPVEFHGHLIDPVQGRVIQR
jgi:hypothetical protein